MKDFGFAASAPICLVILFCGLALLLGADPWTIARTASIAIPIIAYVGFSVFTVFWAIKVGEVGVHQNMTFQAKFYFWHGVSVVACIVLAAAGSFIVLFALQMRGLVSGSF